MDLILHFLLLGGVIFALAEAMPGVEVRNYTTALIVAVVYGLVNITLGSVLKLLTLPFIVLTVGILLIVINAVMLWITDLVVDDFKIRDAGTTLLAAFVITLADTILAWIF